MFLLVHYLRDLIPTEVITTRIGHYPRRMRKTRPRLSARVPL